MLGLIGSQSAKQHDPIWLLKGKASAENGRIMIEIGVLDQAEQRGNNVGVCIGGRQLPMLLHTRVHATDREDANQGVGRAEGEVAVPHVLLGAGEGESVIAQMIDEELFKHSFIVREALLEARSAFPPDGRGFGCERVLLGHVQVLANLTGVFTQLWVGFLYMKEIISDICQGCKQLLLAQRQKIDHVICFLEGRGKRQDCMDARGISRAVGNIHDHDQFTEMQKAAGKGALTVLQDMQTSPLDRREESRYGVMLMCELLHHLKRDLLARKGHWLCLREQQLHHSLTAVGALTLICVFGFGTAGIVTANGGNGILTAFALQSTISVGQMKGTIAVPARRNDRIMMLARIVCRVEGGVQSPS